MRCIRLLHEWEIGDKKIVVRVDAKTKQLLENYKVETSKLWAPRKGKEKVCFVIDLWRYSLISWDEHDHSPITIIIESPPFLLQ